MKSAAVRAVGSACGANPVALVIPCHRALRSDGGLGGYAWGLERKGLVVRAPDAQDRRSLQLMLTPAGHELLSRSIPVVQAVYLTAWSHIGEQATQQLQQEGR